jgi:hypothetical protein
MSQLAAHESYAYDGQYDLWKIQQYNCMLSLFLIIVLAADRSKLRQNVGNSNNGCHTAGDHLQKRKRKRKKRRKKTMPTRMRTMREGVHPQVIKTEKRQCASRRVTCLEGGLLALQDHTMVDQIGAARISSFRPTATQLLSCIQLPRVRHKCREGKVLIYLDPTTDSSRLSITSCWIHVMSPNLFFRSSSLLTNRQAFYVRTKGFFHEGKVVSLILSADLKH